MRRPRLLPRRPDPAVPARPGKLRRLSTAYSGLPAWQRGIACAAVGVVVLAYVLLGRHSTLVGAAVAALLAGATTDLVLRTPGRAATALVLACWTGIVPFLGYDVGEGTGTGTTAPVVVLAAFGLAAGLAAHRSPGVPWRTVALSLLVTAVVAGYLAGQAAGATLQAAVAAGSLVLLYRSGRVRSYRRDLLAGRLRRGGRARALDERAIEAARADARARAERKAARTGPAAAALAGLPAGTTVVRTVPLPGGRSAWNLVVGPGGAVLVEDLPPGIRCGPGADGTLVLDDRPLGGLLEQVARRAVETSAALGAPVRAVVCTDASTPEARQPVGLYGDDGTLLDEVVVVTRDALVAETVSQDGGTITGRRVNTLVGRAERLGGTVVAGGAPPTPDEEPGEKAAPDGDLLVRRAPARTRRATAIVAGTRVKLDRGLEGFEVDVRASGPPETGPDGERVVPVCREAEWYAALEAGDPPESAYWPARLVLPDWTDADS